jgi:hypothetical protein
MALNHTSTTASILFKEELTRMTLPTVTPLILTGVPVQIPLAWANSKTPKYFLNLDRIWNPLNHAKLSAKRTAPDTRNNPTPPSQMLLRPNPKSLNGRNVCLQIFLGISKTTPSGFFFSEEEDGWLWPASADIALTLLSFMCDLVGRQGKQFEELLGRVINDEDSTVGHVETWTKGFHTIFCKVLNGETVPIANYNCSFIGNTYTKHWLLEPILTIH